MNREESYFIVISAKADLQRKVYGEAEPAAERLYDVLGDNFDLLDYCETDSETIEAASSYCGYIEELSDLQDLNETAQILGRDLRLEIYDGKRTKLLRRICYRADGIVVIDTENL